MISLNEAYSYSINEARKFIGGENFFRIFSHYDADGVSSALILAETLRRMKKSFHLSFLKSMELGVIKESSDYPLILSDLGSEVIDDLSSRKVIIIDHHMIPSSEGNGTINLNPRRFGYDGTKEACSSTVAFLLSMTLDEGNFDLFPAFLAGVIGDKQNVGGFNGINLKIVESMKEHYPSYKDLNISGKTISEAIFLSMEPYIDGLSGNLEASRYFVKNMGIDPDAPPINLRTDEKDKIVDSLTMRLIKQDVAKEGYETIVSEVFNFKDLGLSGNQICDYFDAAGRSGKMGLPTSWFMGNDDAKEEMDGLSMKLKKDALAQIKESFTTKREMENLHIAHVASPFLTGITASTLMIYLVKKTKPVLVLYSNKGSKVSGRATRDLIAKGVDLSRAVGEAASEVGGHGGGHDIAAGGEIPFDKEEEFLKNLDKRLGEQLGHSKESPKI